MDKITRIILTLFILGTSTAVFSQVANTACFDCHDDPEFTMEKKGKEISINVNPKKFSMSAHADLSCVECHIGYDPDEEPHTEVAKPVDCAACHDDNTKHMMRSAHAAELNCFSCHSNVHLPEPKDFAKNNCVSCHKDENKALMSSVHATIDERPECVTCHTPHTASTLGSEACLSCHTDAPEDISGRMAEFSLPETPGEFANMIHGDDLECSDCHGAHNVLKVDTLASPVHPVNLAQTCNECHDDVVEEFMKSEHSVALEEGFETAPTCIFCHNEHQAITITGNGSKMSRQLEVETCLSCHLDSEGVSERMTHTSSFIGGYKTSVHGRKFFEGDTTVAICSDCHGAHGALKAGDALSKVNKFNIAKTCGKCHTEIAEVYNASVHGDALREGLQDAPTCTDCHGEHNILEHTVANSPVAQGNVAVQVCGPCHNSVRLASKFGLPESNYSSYQDSYHGLAVRFGSTEVANCASCHGVHNILPSTDSLSTIHVSNLAETCGECHPGANANFTVGKVHVSATSGGDDILNWISSIYILIILITIGGMVVHNSLDLAKKVKEHYHDQYEKEITAHELAKRKKHYIRMTGNERIQHFVLFTTFFMLVITGFMLKFPDAWWVVLLRQWGGEPIFTLRSLLHRIAAVGMVGVSLYHIGYLFATKRGFGLFKDMLPKLQDAKDLVLMMKYYLGFSKSRPAFDRFGYIEKAEYWALIWGTIVMTLTGFALWFENQSMAWFSKLFIDVCEVIHYYEAWLAFLAIVVWHIYYVIFNPDVYPMNFTWLTGKISEEEMEKEHALELERIKKAEAEDESNN